MSVKKKKITIRVYWCQYKVVTVTVFLCQQERHSFDEYNKRGYDVKKGNELEPLLKTKNNNNKNNNNQDCSLGPVKTCCLIRALDRSVMCL